MRAILVNLMPLAPKLARFSAAANQHSGQQVVEDQRYLLALHWTFTGIAIGLILCGVAFIGLLVFQNRMLGGAHTELEAMAADLRVARDNAEAASDAKSRFLATMSHELRTPLNAILGFGEMLESEVFGPIGNAGYRSYIGDIVRSGKHMLSLVTDILTMAKLESGHYEIETEVIELGEIVETTVKMVQGSEIAREREISIDAAAEWPRICADDRAIRQMLLNLLSNAVKFSPPESVVSVFAVRRANGELKVTVADTGIGMTKEQAEIAVRPFQQIDNRLARKYEGRRPRSKHRYRPNRASRRGRLEIESEPGAGSSVSLIFPCDAVVDGVAALDRAA